MFLRIVLLFVIFLLPACEDKDLNLTNIPDHLIQKNNKGVGQMGYYDYAAAYDTFSEIYQQQPEWRLAHLNLIIAMLNRQQTDDEARALQMALDISNKDPNDLTAHYLAAILLYNQGDCETAIKHLDVVVKADESDAYAWYFKAQCLLQTGDMLQAVSLFKKSIKQDPHLRSAYYGLFLSSQRTGNMDLAEKSLEDYQKLELNPKARLAEIKYTRMGSKAEAKSTLIKVNNKLINIGKEPFFLQPDVIQSNQVIESVSLVDLSLAGETSFVTRVDDKLLAYQQTDLQWQSDSLSVDFTHKEGQISWVDFNNDQLLDIFLSGQTDQIFIQDENKKFIPVDMQSYGFTATSSKQVKLFDADHDGDIDIGMINQGGEFALWNNNGNNTFRNISDEIISENDNQGFLQLLVSDVDGDRDLDVLLLHDQYVLILINDRMWSYQAETHSIDRNMQSMSSAYNAEGLFQLWILSKDQQISVMTYDFTKKNFISKNHSLATPAKSFELADINGSGVNELLLFNNESITIFDTFNFNILDSIEFEQDQTDFFVLHGLKGPELLVYNDFSFSHYPASLNRGDYMLLGFSGKHEKANSMRSNSLGLGAEFF
ncbi:MAG: FG-GAP-like repeat-containing protein, partial [Proteobacteria bacterium]|nr:FG-GAP-like repeat-containing protein [Pseudomonadota bacterium]